MLVEWRRDDLILQESWWRGFRRTRYRDGDPARAVEDAPRWERTVHADGAPGNGYADAARWFRSIPAAIRGLAEWLYDQQWVALEAMRHVRGFARFLAQERAAGNRGFVLAAWKEARVWRMPREIRLRLARRIMMEPRAALLGSLLGRPVHPAAPRLLARFDLPVTGDAEIAAEAASCPLLRAGLSGRGRVTRTGLYQALQLPEWMRLPTVVRAAAGHPGGAPRVQDLTEPPLGDLDPAFRRPVLQSLKSARTWDQLARRLKAQAHAVSLLTHFPPPPIPGDGKLQPIACPSELIAEAAATDHCIADYARKIQRGEIAAYRWHGEERATLTLYRDRSSDFWNIHAIHARANASVTPATYAAAMQVANAQLRRRSARWRIEVAGMPYHDAHRAGAPIGAGMSLELRREPGNPHDGDAVAVWSPDGFKLGYVPRACNGALARHLDLAGVATLVLAQDWPGPSSPLPGLLTLDPGAEGFAEPVLRAGQPPALYHATAIDVPLPAGRPARFVLRMIMNLPRE